MRYSKVKEKIKLDGTNEVEVGRIYNVWHTTAEVNDWIKANNSGKGEKAFNWSHQINKEHGLQTYRTDDGTEKEIKKIPIMPYTVTVTAIPLLLLKMLPRVSDIGVQSIPKIQAAVLNRYNRTTADNRRCICRGGYRN